jgi:hypothetical protein
LVAVLIALMETLIRFALDSGWPLPTAFYAAPAFFALAMVGPVAKWLDLRRLRPQPVAPAQSRAASQQSRAASQAPAEGGRA